MVNSESRPRVVLGVSGGIAAYKACELLRRFTESGHDVTVVPTAAALEFVGAPTWAALSGKPVSTEVWTNVHEVPHVRIGQAADLVVVAPATADLLAKAAHGLADDLLTNTLLTARCPVVFAPAMHTEMWEHPATRANVATLRSRGAVVLEPAEGRLTGADTGKGRLPDPGEIFALASDLLARRGEHGGAAAQDLAGLRVVVSAGGTREYLDPVRFIGNRSSGLQGYALARTAAARGAEVTLVAANVTLPDPAGVKVVRVETTAQLQEHVVEACASADAVVMAAAPADFRPESLAVSKIKKSEDGTSPDIRLVQNPDILAGLAHERPNDHIVVVGFAAETGDDSGSVMEHARAKLARKGCDLLVVNDVGGGAVFGSEDNEAVVLAAGGAAVNVPLGSKAALAHVIWDRVLDTRATNTP
jgi:phosphopantothenoylcysteine decarboxylase/phosphopantothenate--cysteine ligase